MVNFLSIEIDDDELLNINCSNGIDYRLDTI